MNFSVNQRQRTQRPRAGSLLFAAVVPTVMLLAGCAQQPERFVADFDQALASKDADRVAKMLTPGSRHMLRALWAVDAAPAPDAATAVANPAGHAAFEPQPPSAPTRFVRAYRDTSGIVFKVEADGEEREWVVRQVGYGWQLDLLATSSRSSWTGY